MEERRVGRKEEGEEGGGGEGMILTFNQVVLHESH